MEETGERIRADLRRMTVDTKNEYAVKVHEELIGSIHILETLNVPEGFHQDYKNNLLIWFQRLFDIKESLMKVG